MSNSNNQTSVINSFSGVEEKNNIQHEPLFTELSSEAAATVEGGASFLFRTTVTDRLRIRSSPSIKVNNIIDYWERGQTKRMRTPAIRTGGFRAFGLRNASGWVSEQFIKLIPGTYNRY